MKQLARHDHSSLPAALHDAATRLRVQLCESYQSDVFAHSFRVVGYADPGSSHRLWRVICDACMPSTGQSGPPGISAGTGASDSPYLFYFKRQHLDRPQHAAAARLRLEALRVCVEDSARRAAAEESAERASAAASTWTGRRPGDFEPLVEQASELELLVASTPALAWIESEDGDRLGVRCAWCRLS